MNYKLFFKEVTEEMTHKKNVHLLVLQRVDTKRVCPYVHLKDSGFSVFYTKLQ